MVINYCDTNNNKNNVEIRWYQQCLSLYLRYEMFENCGINLSKEEIEQLKIGFRDVIKVENKSPLFEPLLCQYYLFCNRNRFDYFLGILEKGESQRLAYYLASLNEPGFVYNRKLKLIPTGGLGSIKKLPEEPFLFKSSHREIAKLYEDCKLHDKMKQNIASKHKGDHGLCAFCQEQAKFHSIHYLKHVLVGKNCKIDNLKPYSMRNSYLNLITVSQFKKLSREKMSPAMLFNADDTIKKLNTAYTMFRDWQKIHQDDKVRDISEWQFCILRMDMIQLLFTALQYGYIPAYFQLQKLICRDGQTKEEDEAAFKAIYKILRSDDVCDKKRIIALADKPDPSTIDEKIKWIRVHFEKNRNFTMSFNGRAESFSCVCGLLLRREGVAKIVDGSQPQKAIEKIKGLYNKLSLSQRQLFDEMRSKTGIFNLNIRSKDEYSTWQELVELAKQESEQKIKPRNFLQKHPSEKKKDESFSSADETQSFSMDDHP